MRPILQPRPPSNSFLQIMIAFNKGHPLSAEQMNYLRRYYHKISNTNVDSICNYYGVLKQPAQERHEERHNFFLSRSFKSEVLQELEKEPIYEIKFTPNQLLQFKALFLFELIFLHVGDDLTFPFNRKKVANIEFFQWGNLFGIIRYEKNVQQSANHPTILMHFERQQGLSLSQFVHHNLLNSIRPKNTVLLPASNLYSKLDILKY